MGLVEFIKFELPSKVNRSGFTSDVGSGTVQKILHILVQYPNYISKDPKIRRPRPSKKTGGAWLGDQVLGNLLSGAYGASTESQGAIERVAS